MARFDAPWDRSLKLTTSAFLVLLLGMAAGLGALTIALQDQAGAWWAIAIAPVFIAAAVPCLWLLAPRAFDIEGGDLVVVRPLFPVPVPLASIRAVTLLDRSEAGTFFKVAGSGGVFGHYGRYWSRRLGAFRLYATRRDQLVVVDTENGRFVLTPATPERFIDALKRAAPQASVGLGGGLDHMAAGHPAGAWKLVAGIIASVALVIGTMLIIAAARAPFAVNVDAEAIRIERRWSEPVLVPVSEVREVVPLTATQSRGWWRVNGVGGLGNSSYGSYRSKDLGPFTLYAWRRGPYVLLETASGRVVLTPDDPPAFIANVQALLNR
jgi:hypothetical protein